MSSDLIADALELTKKQLALKKADLHRLDGEVRRLESAVMALTALVNKPKEIDVAAGITEAVKQALRIQVPNGLFPTTIKLRLEEAGFPFEDMKNPMPTIHSVLRRLEKSGFVARVKGKDGKTAYFWKTDWPVRKQVVTKNANAEDDDIPF